MSLTAVPEQGARGAAWGQHTLQLFDTSESRGQGVARFLAAGLADGGRGLIIAKPAHVVAIGESLAMLGCPLGQLIDEGRMTVLDAASVARDVMRCTSPDPERFEASIGRRVRELVSSLPASPLFVYGEVVDLLAEERNFDGARALEQLWNELGARVGFSLLCGYASAHFAAPPGTSILPAVCVHHTQVIRNHEDLLASWLLGKAERTG